DPDIQTSLGQKLGGLRIIGPAFRGADRARPQRDRRVLTETFSLPKTRQFVSRHAQLRNRPFRRPDGTVWQSQNSVLVDMAGQGALAPAPAVEQAEPGLANKTDPFRYSGKCRRERRFPGSRQDDGGRVSARPEFGGEAALVGERQPAARQVPDHA